MQPAWSQSNWKEMKLKRNLGSTHADVKARIGKAREIFIQ